MARASRTSSRAISAMSLRAFSRARARASGVILARSVLKVLCHGVPPIRVSACRTDHRQSARIGRTISGSPVLSPPISKIAMRLGSKAYSTRNCRCCTLPTQLLHVGMPGLHNDIGMRTGKSRATFFQQMDLAVDFFLLFFAESVPPTSRIHRCTRPPMP